MAQMPDVAIVTGGARRSRSGEEDGVVGFLCRAGSVQALASWDQVGVVALALHAADPVRPALTPMSAPVPERALTDTGNGMSFDRTVRRMLWYALPALGSGGRRRAAGDCNGR